MNPSDPILTRYRRRAWRSRFEVVFVKYSVAAVLVILGIVLIGYIEIPFLKGELSTKDIWLISFFTPLLITIVTLFVAFANQINAPRTVTAKALADLLVNAEFRKLLECFEAAYPRLGGGWKSVDLTSSDEISITAARRILEMHNSVAVGVDEGGFNEHMVRFTLGRQMFHMVEACQAIIDYDRTLGGTGLNGSYVPLLVLVGRGRRQIKRGLL